LQDIGIRPRDLRGIDIDAALRRGIGDNNTMDVETRERAPLNNGSSSDSRKYKGLLSGETKEISF
jgi:hypothetical protein